MTMITYIPQAGAFICVLCDAVWAFWIGVLMSLSRRSKRVHTDEEFAPRRPVERDLDMKRARHND